MKVPCVCIDAKNRPSVIPPSMWINEGTEYHITHVYYYPNQGIQGVLLEEVSIKKGLPYDSYRLSRFAFTKEAIFQLIELIKLCTELNDVDINKLLEQSEIEVLEK